MNVIVSNTQKGIIDNANIDAIKDLNGLFNVDDLVNKFKNYFFSKMILDATSVVDFAKKEVLQKLADEIGTDRLIILLPATPEPPEEFKKMLIDLKIYNFSNKIDEVVRFIEKPNTYESIMNTIMNSSVNSSEYYVDNSIKEGEDVSDDVEVGEDVEEVNEKPMYDDVRSNTINNTHASLGDIMNTFDVYDNDAKGMVSNEEEKVEDNLYSSEKVEEENNESEVTDTELDKEDNNSNSINETEKKTYTFLNIDGFDNEPNTIINEKKIIGFKNVTLHAGSTTLIYLLHKVAQAKGKDILSIEINRDDFRLFRNSKMISVGESNLSSVLDNARESIVLVDLNDCQDDSFCKEIIYLVEPSTIKLNKLMMENRNVFNTLKDKKIILNQSMLKNEDVPVLENEAGMKFFKNITSINDRIDNLVIEELFDKLIND